MIIAGGGVQYSGAVAELTAFAEAHEHPCGRDHCGPREHAARPSAEYRPVGVTGSDSANAIAEKADVIFAVGTRLQDFTTGSWTAFAKDAKIIGVNVARHDAAKHMSMPLWVTRSWRRGACAMADYKAPATWTALCTRRARKWEPIRCRECTPGNGPNSYAQAIGVVNDLCDPRDRVVAAAGGLPAEVTANWQTT